MKKKVFVKDKKSVPKAGSMLDDDILKAMKESGLGNHDIFEDMARQFSNNESIRELVDVKNIRLKTKVTDRQHKLIVLLYGLYMTLLSRYGIHFTALKNILDQFIELAPSLDGKRAEQFVQAHQALAQQMALANQQKGINQQDMKITQ